MTNYQKKSKSPKGKKQAKKQAKTTTTKLPYQSPTVSDDDSHPLDNPLDLLLINSKPDDIPKPIRLNNAYADWLAEEAAGELEPVYKKESVRLITIRYGLGESLLRYRISCKKSKAEEVQDR